MTNQNQPKTTYLEPVYAKAKSFNHKATVTVFDDRTILRSYELKVAMVEGGVLTIHNIDKWTATTVRHVHEFVQQRGYQLNIKSNIKQALIDSFHVGD